MGLRGPKVKESVFTIDRENPPKKVSNRPKKYKKRVKKIDPSVDENTLSNPITEQSFDDNLMGDLLWVYQKLGGKNQLLSMLQTDPKARKDFLKLMLDYESKKLMQNRGGGGGKGKLLVLRGLYDEEQTIGKQAKSLNKILDPMSEKGEEEKKIVEDYIYEVDEVIVDEEVVG